MGLQDHNARTLADLGAFITSSVRRPRYAEPEVDDGPTYGGCEGTCSCGRPATHALERTGDLICDVCRGVECADCGADLLGTDRAPRCAGCRGERSYAEEMEATVPSRGAA